jgi:hypothetical protein
MDRQLLLIKKEVTYGTDPTAAATNTIWAEDVEFKPSEGSRVTPNPAKPGVGPVADHVFGQYVDLAFKIPLIGSADPGEAPKWGPLMKACGWGETVVADTSVTYALMANPRAADSITAKWRDGNRRLHLAKGGRGRVGLQLSAGQRPMLVFNMKLLHTVVSQAGADLAHADADFSDWLDAKPVASGTTTFSLDSVSGLGLRELSFNQSDNVRFIDVPEQKNVELLGERTFTGNLKTTTPQPNTLNYEQLWVDGEVVTWSMVHDSNVTINGRSQILAPAYSRDNGDDVVTAGLKLVPSSLTTDDDLAIVLT